MATKIFPFRKYGKSKQVTPWQVDPEVERQLELERREETRQREIQIAKKIERAQERKERRELLREIDDRAREHAFRTIPGQIVGAYVRCSEEDKATLPVEAIPFLKQAGFILKKWWDGEELGCCICGRDVTNWEKWTDVTPHEFGVLIPNNDHGQPGHRMGGIFCPLCSELSLQEKYDHASTVLAKMFTGGFKVKEWKDE